MNNIRVTSRTITIKPKMSMLSAFLLLLSFMPVADALNGYMLKHNGVKGIGSAYHTLFLIIGLAVLFSRKFKMTSYGKILLVMCSSITFTILLNYLADGGIQPISLERVIKILTTIINIYIFDRLFSGRILSRDHIINVIYWQCVLVLAITFFADVSGISNRIYTDSSGRIGFYAGSNEPTIILTVIEAFLLWFLETRNDVKDAILFVIGLVCLILTASKSGVAIAAAYGVIFARKLFKKTKSRGKSKKLVLLVIILVSGFFAGYTAYQKIRISFINRQIYLHAKLSSHSTFAYLSSGRIVRIKTLFIDSFDEYSHNTIGGGGGTTPIKTYFRNWINRGLWWYF